MLHITKPENLFCRLYQFPYFFQMKNVWSITFRNRCLPFFLSRKFLRQTITGWNFRYESANLLSGMSRLKSHQCQRTIHFDDKENARQSILVAMCTLQGDELVCAWTSVIPHYLFRPRVGRRPSFPELGHAGSN